MPADGRCLWSSLYVALHPGLEPEPSKVKQWAASLMLPAVSSDRAQRGVCAEQEDLQAASSVLGADVHVYTGQLGLGPVAPALSLRCRNEQRAGPISLRLSQVADGAGVLHPHFDLLQRLQHAAVVGKVPPTPASWLGSGHVGPYKSRCNIGSCPSEQFALGGLLSSSCLPGSLEVCDKGLECFPEAWLCNLGSFKGTSAF